MDTSWGLYWYMYDSGNGKQSTRNLHLHQHQCTAKKKLQDSCLLFSAMYITSDAATADVTNIQ